MARTKKLSVVTISFNQRDFLRECIDSVLSQKTDDIEYIVVDPGSTDGSREIIAEYGNAIDLVVLEKDSGPADGLNNGFSRATGSVYYYLNSDDVVWPNAFNEALAHLGDNPDVDVVAGSGAVIDAAGRYLRKVTSDPVSRRRLAYGSGILIQPATFIRSTAFNRAGGFNTGNKSNWDGELVVDMFLGNCRFHIVDKMWGGYRLHEQSITATGRTLELIKAWNERKRDKLGVSQSPAVVKAMSTFFRFERLCREPSRISERLRRGKVFGAATE